VTGERAQRPYYWDEHERAYRRIVREGKTAWEDLHGGAGFDAFAHRPFLERVLPTLPLAADPARSRALEVGCGAGPGACFLAARGYRVDGLDLIPAAIALARRFAADRGLEVRYTVADVCTLGPLPAGQAPPYDLVVDGYCLQSIVTDADRARLFAAVRSRLKPEGFYLIATAMYDPARVYGPDDHYDAATAVAYGPIRGAPEACESAVRIGDRWYQPNRRHLTPPALAAELEGAGFRVLSQEGALGGEVVCTRSPADARSPPQGPRRPGTRPSTGPSATTGAVHPVARHPHRGSQLARQRASG
jgi:SAM-dependent methyltransferase